MTIIDTTISDVTIYTNQALVTRRGTVTLTGEERELIVTGIPLSIQTESLRVRGAGTVPVQILAVQVENIFDSEPLTEKAAQISRQIKYLEQQKRTVQDQLAAVQLQRNFIEGLSEKSLERLAGSFATPQLNLDEIKELLNFLGEQYGDYANGIAQREKQLRDIDKQIEICVQQARQLQKPTIKEIYSSYNIIISIEPSSIGDLQLEISYLVNRVIWTPVYDLRSQTNSNQISIAYLAEIRQKTGEDWNGVTLTFSTAKPALGILPPTLEPWYISGRKSDFPSDFSARSEDDIFTELEALLAEENDATKKHDLVVAQRMLNQASKSGSVVTFHLDRASTIPSDGAPHKVTILTNNYPCRTEYAAIPRLISFAYLEATVTNRSNGVTLLPGKAYIIRDNTLVGTTQLPNVAPGQEFKVNLGVDEGVSIERILVEREVEIINTYRRTTYAYKIGVSNLRDRKTTLRLIEQLPISRDEQIKVRLLSTHPEIQLGQMGQLEWLLTLQPRSKRQYKQELYYQFTLEHPLEIAVVSLDI
ncbi:MAG TPA: mucoidy inhibitor MuiA family protein [Leptolyngbyaceae cyanobacterium]